MIYLSQRDPRWSQTKLGTSSLTLGRFGCTTTCIAMLSDYFGGRVLPDAIAKTPNNYTKDGLIIWGNLKFEKMKFVQRVVGRTDWMIKESLKDPNKAVILAVNDSQHWIVALRKTLIGNDYICLDPWTGKKCQAIRDYRNITGSAHFARK